MSSNASSRAQFYDLTQNDSPPKKVLRTTNTKSLTPPPPPAMQRKNKQYWTYKSSTDGNTDRSASGKRINEYNDRLAGSQMQVIPQAAALEALNVLKRDMELSNHTSVASEQFATLANPQTDSTGIHFSNKITNAHPHLEPAKNWNFNTKIPQPQPKFSQIDDRGMMSRKLAQQQDNLKSGSRQASKEVSMQVAQENEITHKSYTDDRKYEAADVDTQGLTLDFLARQCTPTRENFRQFMVSGGKGEKLSNNKNEYYYHTKNQCYINLLVSSVNSID